MEGHQGIAKKRRQLAKNGRPYPWEREWSHWDSRAIAIGPADARLEANAHALIALPEASPEISALLAVLPLQLLSYYMSVGRGFNPDFPRNLSKTLTVD